MGSLSISVQLPFNVRRERTIGKVLILFCWHSFILWDKPSFKSSSDQVKLLFLYFKYLWTLKKNLKETIRSTCIKIGPPTPLPYGRCFIFVFFWCVRHLPIKFQPLHFSFYIRLQGAGASSLQSTICRLPCRQVSCYIRSLMPKWKSLKR